MDAGGLAQMTYNAFNQGATTSFSSRGKASHLRNISVPASSNMSAPVEQQPVTTPRTARSALLAGLRTAPRTPNPTPTSAATVDMSNASMDSYSNTNFQGSSAFSPNTGRGLGYAGSNSRNHTGQSTARNQQQLPTPPSSSPALGLNGEMLDLDEMELQDNAEMYKQLLATNYMLAQQSAQLQQQLANLAASSAAARQVQQLQQQLQQLQLQTSSSSNFSTPPMSPGLGMNMYINTPQGVPATSIYPVFNPMTGQYQYYVQPQSTTPSYQQQQQQQSPVVTVQVETSSPVTSQPPQREQPSQQQQQQQLTPSPTPSMSSSRANSRSRSPPKLNLQQSNTNPTSTGFRKGHRKASSLSTCINVSSLDIAEAPKTSVPKLSMLPATPSTATFAPGHASGCHPIRQPRGPPSIEELKAKPTSKEEGSKNFATRQRRRAISKLVTAGMERRTARSVSGSVGGTMTPVSEVEAFAFEDGDSVASSVSGRQSRQSLRCGGESPPEYSASSVSGDEGLGGKFLEIKESGGLKAPKLVLNAAEKRRSALF